MPRHVLVSGFLVLLAADFVFASTWQADPSTVGDWNDGANWGGSVPSSWAYINNGGTASITSDVPYITNFYLGYSANSSGSIIQDGGTFRMYGPSYVGYSSTGEGTYLQKSGTLIVEMPFGGASLIIGGKRGAYTMEDGYLSVKFFGNSMVQGLCLQGTANLTQKGGLIETCTVLTYDNSNISLQGGTFRSYGLLLGRSGTTVFTHTGGTLETVGDRTNQYRLLDLGDMAGSDVTYLLSGSGTVISRGIWIGPVGKGLFSQSGGSVEGNLVIGSASSPGGRYEISDGMLNSYSINLNGGNSSGSAAFLQTGGTVQATGQILVGGSNGIVNSRLEVQAGSMTAKRYTIGGTFIIGADAKLTATGTVSLGATAVFTAAAGSGFHLQGGALVMEGTNASAVSGLGNLRLYAEGDTCSYLEAAGLDMGRTEDGLVSNFALDSLIVGAGGAGSLRLINSFDNQPGSSVNDCVYVRNLVLEEGSELDLNGLNLYYQTFRNDGGTVIENGGSLRAIPEPATLSLLLAVLPVLGRKRRAQG